MSNVDVRQARRSRMAELIGRAAADHLSLAESLVRASLRVGHSLGALLGQNAMPALTRLIRRIVGSNVPLWLSDMPKPAARLPSTTREARPLCIGLPA